MEENKDFNLLLEKLSKKAKIDGTEYKIEVDSEVFDKGDRIIWFKQDRGISPDVLQLKTVKGNLENALLELNKLNKNENLLEKLFDIFLDNFIQEEIKVSVNGQTEETITCDNIIEHIDYISDRFCKWMLGNDELCSDDIIIKIKDFK